jgi:hypothetical protein
VDAGLIGAEAGTVTEDTTAPAASSAGTGAEAGTSVEITTAPAESSAGTGAEAGTSIDDAIAQDASSAENVADGSQSNGGDLPPVADGNAGASQNPQPATGRNQQDALAAAMRMFGAGESTVAPASSFNTANAFDLLKPQLSIEQAVSASSPTPFPAALRPTELNLQSWLDDWLGPHARAFGVLPETTETPETEDGQPRSVQEFRTPYLPGDLPELQTAESLAAEQIAQQYDDIRIWLDANPGIELGMTASSGSPPERNPFTCIGAVSAGDYWYASMPEFGQTPGFATLGGHALVPLRGIKDGFTQLGID